MPICFAFPCSLEAKWQVKKDREEEGCVAGRKRKRAALASQRLASAKKLASVGVCWPINRVRQHLLNLLPHLLHLPIRELAFRNIGEKLLGEAGIEGPSQHS